MGDRFPQFIGIQAADGELIVVRLVHRWVFGAGFAALAVTILVLVAPVHGPGLSGSALVPHISDFGWYAYAPLPANPTHAQLRAAGVVGPWDSLAHRRHEVFTAAAVAAGLLETGFVLRRLRRRRERSGECTGSGRGQAAGGGSG